MPPPPPHADPGSGVDEGMHPVGFVPGPVPGSVPGPASGSGPGPGPGPGSEILDQNRPLARYLVAQLDGCKERLMVVEPRTGAGGGRGEPRGGGGKEKTVAAVGRVDAGGWVGTWGYMGIREAGGYMGIHGDTGGWVGTWGYMWIQEAEWVHGGTCGYGRLGWYMGIQEAGWVSRPARPSGLEWGQRWVRVGAVELILVIMILNGSSLRRAYL